MGHPLYFLRGHKSEFPNYDVFLCLNNCFNCNKVVPDHMLHTVVFYLGLYCLPKYLFNDLLYKKG